MIRVVSHQGMIHQWLAEPVVSIAIIWAAVIVATAVVLAGTEYFSVLLPILGGGSAVTIAILGGTRKRDLAPKQRKAKRGE